MAYILLRFSHTVVKLTHPEVITRHRCQALHRALQERVLGAEHRKALRAPVYRQMGKHKPMHIRVLRFQPRQLLWLAAAVLLGGMVLLLLGSVREDSLTADEPAHITAGYAYLSFRDGRFNPEHPPLLKMLAAVPLLPLSLHFPRDHPAWQDGPNGVWELMGVFLFESGHDLHRIAALARLAPIGLTVTLGLVLFLWARSWAGDRPALLALCLYAWSPTVLAHGR